jgi:hypothetical protein
MMIVIMLGAVILSAVMLSFVMLSVLTPQNDHKTFRRISTQEYTGHCIEIAKNYSQCNFNVQ